jgi:hypothetical protein
MFNEFHTCMKTDTEIELSIWEQGADGNIWTKQGWNCRKSEKTA